MIDEHHIRATGIRIRRRLGSGLRFGSGLARGRLGTLETQVAAARQIAGAHPLWAGIGAYRLTSEQIVENAQTARRIGVNGIILFSYDSLTDPSRGPGYLSQVGRAAFQF